MAMGQGQPGLWLIDENDATRFTVSIHGFGITQEQSAAIAMALADCIPDEGIDVPE